MPSHNYAQEIMRLVVSSTLKRRAKEYFLGLKRVKETTGYKSGRLDTSALTGVLRGRVDCFKRKEDVRMIDSAVSILVDSSGSMSGSCYTQACASALMLADCLSSVGVKIEVAGFTDRGKDRLIHQIHCAFGERFNKTEVFNSMVEMGNNLYSNADAENVMIAYDRLLQVEASKRILIVLSDGEPSGHTSYNDYEALQQVCAFIEREKARTNTELWGIGIGGNTSIKQYYNNSVYVDNDSKMGDVLLTLIKQAVTVKQF